MVTEKGIPKIAYFCMEIALDPSIPSYGGGLGILAGDMLRSAADLELPMVAISLEVSAHLNLPISSIFTIVKKRRCGL